MNSIADVKAILDKALQLGGRAKQFNGDTRLFGDIAEFDSMAVVTVVTAIEERFGIAIEDDEITADIFETVGSLASFVDSKISA